ncbi:ISL3 family transposase [Streptomyces camelliae]|uniref:ISL3 family transposase n=2 Tax=Streptomyces camelliae TaxID=3004093 RepID=A0ABY7PJZ4_9ACTN|nr:ISL3 family transposase [Streptomyces sp. HUAS 2-6]WBO69003.1 ISL3 family transposase [Streptomyces sp. HUAS 2-6]
MQTDAPFWESLVFDGIDDVDVEAVTAAFGTVEVVANGRAAGAACPACGRFSDRVHGRYLRRLRDLPLADQGFLIRLRVRRFICGSVDCPRRTFAEPFSRLAAPHARFTTRLNHVLERVGLALAGRAGARLAAELGFGAGRMTLLRRVMALSDPRSSTPRVLGVDDFAIRRGQTYSNVLTSVEDHRAVDVFPTREAGPLAAWLIRHPGVEIICRDRASAYAEGARRGAPDAFCRSPTGSICGRASAEPSRPASPPTATACAVPRPAACYRGPPDCFQDGPRTTRSPSADGPSGRRQHTHWSTSCLPKAIHAGRSPDTWAGASTPSSGRQTPHAGRTPSATTGPDPAGWTPTSPTWSDASPQDAPASPTSTTNSLPSTRPSPTRWSAPTSPPSASLRSAHQTGLRRCAR